MDKQEIAEVVEMLLTGKLGDPASYVAMHGWEVAVLDGGIEIVSQVYGKFRLAVEILEQPVEAD